MTHSVLWWGRFDPDYSRNRILRQILTQQGWQIRDFFPKLSSAGDIEASLRNLPRPDLVWVPCFRQRDLAAARRWSTRHNIPLIADPLISAWDKQVFEREKFPPESREASRIKGWESKLLQSADAVLADTPAHADFFAKELGVPQAKLHVVYVGAEQPLFSCAGIKPPGNPLDVLFYGSFIGLQGATVIVEAARQCTASNVHWTLLGDGPERQRCEQMAAGMGNISFENWLPYQQLPERICRADIILGVFGTTAKAGRVIPNKVFQALACGRPVVTRAAEAYPAELAASDDSGLKWIPPGNPEALEQTVAALATGPSALSALATHARRTYETCFSPECIQLQLAQALGSLSL